MQCFGFLELISREFSLLILNLLFALSGKGRAKAIATDWALTIEHDAPEADISARAAEVGDERQRFLKPVTGMTLEVSFA